MAAPSQTDVDAVIEAYEAEQARRGQADLSQFLAAPGRPRQDEPTWKDGKPLAGPASLVLPGGAERSAGLTEAGKAYRDYCQSRNGHGSDKLESWCELCAAGPENAQLFQDVHRRDPKAAERLAEALTTMPEAGGQFLGFRLVGELGRGAFARVFLAEQGELANRQVVLKISTDAIG